MDLKFYENVYRISKEDNLEEFLKLDLDNLTPFAAFNLSSNIVDNGSSKIVEHVIKNTNIKLTLRPLINMCIEKDEKNDFIREYIISNIKDPKEFIDYDLTRNNYDLSFLYKLYNATDKSIDFVKKCKENKIDYKKVVE